MNALEKYKGYGEDRWYFFMVREPSKTKKKDEPNRKVVVDGVEEGSWSATGSVVQIHTVRFFLCHVFELSVQLSSWLPSGHIRFAS